MVIIILKTAKQTHGYLNDKCYVAVLVRRRTMMEFPTVQISVSGLSAFWHKADMLNYEYLSDNEGSYHSFILQPEGLNTAMYNGARASLASSANAVAYPARQGKVCLFRVYSYDASEPPSIYQFLPAALSLPTH